MTSWHKSREEQQIERSDYLQEEKTHLRAQWKRWWVHHILKMELQDIIQINKDAATTLLKRKKFVVAITPEFFDWLL